MNIKSNIQFFICADLTNKLSLSKQEYVADHISIFINHYIHMEIFLSIKRPHRRSDIKKLT